jgi:hypothetical protein
MDPKEAAAALAPAAALAERARAAALAKVARAAPLAKVARAASREARQDPQMVERAARRTPVPETRRRAAVCARSEEQTSVTTRCLTPKNRQRLAMSRSRVAVSPITWVAFSATGTGNLRCVLKMRGCVFCLPAATLLAACADSASSETHLASEACPLKTPRDWQGFIDAVAEDERWVETCSDPLSCDALTEFAAHVESDVLGTFERCAEDLAENPPIASCTDRLQRFAPTWLSQHASYSYGFRQDNHDYLAAQPEGMMDPPAALIAALPERLAVEAAALSNGWLYLSHDSALGGVRTFVAISDPRGRFDQWLVMNLENPVLLSFIAVQKESATGDDLPAVRLHFRDYLLHEVDGSWQLTLPEQHDGRCYSCHASGLRQLIPTSSSASFNDRLLSYGLPDWGDTLEPGDHGPPLGADLGCTSCHDGRLRGPITVSANQAMLAQKMVGQLSMQGLAPGRRVPDEAAMQLLARESAGSPPLSSEEQGELDEARSRHAADYQDLVASRFPSWKSWTLERACE